MITDLHRLIAGLLRATLELEVEKGEGVGVREALLADVTFGVWIDFSQPQGFAFMPVKGMLLMDHINERDLPPAITLAAVPCDSMAAVLAMRERLERDEINGD